MRDGMAVDALVNYWDLSHHELSGTKELEALLSEIKMF